MDSLVLYNKNLYSIIQQQELLFEELRHLFSPQVCQDEEGEEEDGEGRSQPLNASHAQVVRELVRGVGDLVNKVVDLSEDNKRLAVQAAIPLTELEVRRELGWAQGWRDAVTSLAPTLEKTLPAMAYAYAASQRPDEEGDPTTAEGQLRKRVAALEKEVNLLLMQLAQEQASNLLTPEIQAELRVRLGALMTRFMTPLLSARGRMAPSRRTRNSP